LFARVGFTAVYDKKLADLSAKLSGERGSAAAAIQVPFGYLSTISKQLILQRRSGITLFVEFS
jgi:hypothetical protein